ncbi:phage tail protein [Hoeflea sp. CAU 1731]
MSAIDDVLIFEPPIAPSVGMTRKPEIKLLRAEFGDGYTQATPNGINHIREVITLSWQVLSENELAQIEDFLKSHGGYKTFYYCVPGSALLKFNCDDWEATQISPDYFSLKATFKQTFTNHGIAGI